MGPVWYRLRAEARARWRAWLSLALVAGLTAGAVIAFAAGARRTDSAAMGGVFALAAATLMHVVVTSVRRRARDLAMFKTLGFTRRQLVMTVAWSATTVVLVGLFVGLPVGIATGRWLWIVRAGDLGVVVAPRVPILAVALVAVGALLVANAVGLLPGRRVARSRPAEVLGAE